MNGGTASAPSCCGIGVTARVLSTGSSVAVRMQAPSAGRTRSSHSPVLSNLRFISSLRARFETAGVPVSDERRSLADVGLPPLAPAGGLTAALADLHRPPCCDEAVRSFMKSPPPRSGAALAPGEGAGKRGPGLGQPSTSGPRAVRIAESPHSTWPPTPRLPADAAVLDSACPTGIPGGPLTPSPKAP